MSARPFLDTNILIYALAADDPRAAKAQALVAGGGIISVQVLNEFANVSRRKLGREWPEVEKSLRALRTLLDPAIPVSIELHEAAIGIARDHGLAFYDALIVAAAARAKCRVLYSEDFQDGRTIAGITIRNPFAAA